MGNAGGGRIEPHPGIPALNTSFGACWVCQAFWEGFSILSQLEQRCLPHCSGLFLPLLVRLALCRSPWAMAVPRISTEEGMEGVRGGAPQPRQNPTRQVCPRADSACSSTALRRLCPPRAARSQVARCSRRLPAPACQVWQSPGRATLPGWGCAPEPPLHPMAAAASPVGRSVLPHCDSLRPLGVCIDQLGSLGAQFLPCQGKSVSIIHLCELCPSCRAGGDKHGALFSGLDKLGCARGCLLLLGLCWGSCFCQRMLFLLNSFKISLSPCSEMAGMRKWLLILV